MRPIAAKSWPTGASSRALVGTWRSWNGLQVPMASKSNRAGGSLREPNHKTPETVRLTETTPRPMLGISGLLNLLTWVEHRQQALASQHCEEGGIPCPVSHPTRLPPTQFQTSIQSVGSSAPGQSTAAPLEAPSSARTPAGSEQRTRQGGRR
jgi:hypothetical protein